jgi:hypothetical protein
MPHGPSVLFKLCTQADLPDVSDGTAEQTWPSCSMLAPTNMGSSCHFPATPLGMARQHGFFAVQAPKASTPRAFSTGTGTHQTLGPHRSLIQIVLADASCNIALTVLMALSLAQPSHLIRYIFSSSGLRTPSQSQVLNSERALKFPLSSQERNK